MRWDWRMPSIPLQLPLPQPTKNSRRRTTRDSAIRILPPWWKPSVENRFTAIETFFDLVLTGVLYSATYTYVECAGSTYQALRKDMQKGHHGTKNPNYSGLRRWNWPGDYERKPANHSGGGRGT